MLDLPTPGDTLTEEHNLTTNPGDWELDTYSPFSTSAGTGVASAVGVIVVARAVALHPFAAQAEGDLEFSPGDEIAVTAKGAGRGARS
eukprot:COSAG05_NODE_5961_length_1051_cov_0.640756_2_plen_87_part_01